MDCWELRFIPAYAGNSNELAYPNNQPSVHPRLRGELEVNRQVCYLSIGSSPLTRGTHRSAVSASAFSRFIPAYAGNSPLLLSFFAVCCGSSPLTRGTRAPWPSFSALVAVHPRLRGELRIPSRIPIGICGSSPLTRGTRRLIPYLSVLITVHPRLRGELT